VKQLQGSIGGNTYWSQVTDRTAATAAARAGLYQRFLDQCDGDPQRADHLLRAHMARLSLKAVMARRRKAESGGSDGG
jgi:hypothetical protein